MKKFEYKQVNLGDKLDAAELNKYGAEGWELIKAMQARSPLGPRVINIVLFKREIIEDANKD